MNPKNRISILLCLAGLCALYAVGLGARRVVLQAQFKAEGRVLPFTMESALHFRRVWNIYETGTLPDLDRSVQYPGGVKNWETYSIGSEFLYARLAKLFPERMPLRDRIRWIEAGWFCLGIPLLALWVGIWFRSRVAGAVAGLFYALCLCGLIRSTGQELSRENFALPMVVGFYLFDLLAQRAKLQRGFWGWAVMSSAALSWAMQSWDMVQYAVGLWILMAWWNLLRGGWTLRDRRALLWLVQLAGLLWAGATDPYLRAHAFLVTPTLLAAYGVALSLVLNTWVGRSEGVGWRWGRALLPVMVIVVGGWAAESVSGSYGHFGELLWAKLVHLNQKPPDPALLTYNQRIMWVPALNSADIGLTRSLFPAILPLSLLGSLLLGRHPRFRGDPNFVYLLFCCGFTFITYCLFVRFHVFAAIYFSALMGGCASWAVEHTGWKRGTMGVLLAVGWIVETANVVEEPERWGRSGEYYQDVLEMVDWLRDSVISEPVLANFGTSGMVLTYAGCPILLHPKFEGEEIRERVREYGELLFKGSEQSLRDWALGLGARYYVYGRGEFAERGVLYQMRYFVNALNPPDSVPARLFEKEDADLTYFQPVWKNRKYKVFRIRSDRDLGDAKAWAAEAERGFQHGDLEKAHMAAMKALTLDPMNEPALKIVEKVDRLREQGFGYDGR